MFQLRVAENVTGPSFPARKSVEWFYGLRNPASRLVFEQSYVKAGVFSLILSFPKGNSRLAFLFGVSNTAAR